MLMEDKEKGQKVGTKLTEDTKRSKNWVSWLLVIVFGAVVVTISVFTILRHFNYFRKGQSPHHSKQILDKYNDALQLPMQFFDVQKSGELVDNKISWRGDSGLQDGSEENLDLSKGLYDAGDLIKFGFPMAFTATVLSWAILEYGNQMNAVKQLGKAQDSVKWITDYIINAHPAPNVLYVQVGDPEIDHNCWQRPETTTEKRPLMQINTSFPGTEVAAETAAAMASASLVFRKVNSTYSDTLLMHAKQLFTFADTYRGSYSISIPQAKEYYNSTGYEDELLWAATWLYHATGDESYLRYVTEFNGEAFANWGSPTWFSWDNKHAGVQVLLSRIIFSESKDFSFMENIELQMYRKTAEDIMCELLPDSPTATSSRTDSGLIWVVEWNSLQHSVASAFLAVLYGHYMLASKTETLFCSGKFFMPHDIHEFSISQTDYLMGQNPMKMSYLVGYGSYPLYVHHRGSSIPIDAVTGCRDGFKWLDSEQHNPNIAVGALVGGPFLNESYNDFRRNSMQGEPTTYNSALLVGLLSGLTTNSYIAKSFT